MTLRQRRSFDYFLLTDVMELHFLEMPKLLKDWKQRRLNPRDDILARWMLLLGMVDRQTKTVYEDIFLELEEIAMQDDTLRNAFQHWEAISTSREKRLAYETREKEILDALAAKREAELFAERSRKEGFEKGREEGREEGIVTVAKNMIEKGLDTETIAELTGMAPGKIEKLKKTIRLNTVH